MRPYYEADGITVYHAPCEEVIPLLPADVALVHGEGRVFHLAYGKLDAQVDDGHDGAPQVDDTLDEGRRIGDRGHGVVTADLLHLEDVDGVLLGTEGEGEQFLGKAGFFRLAGSGGVGSLKHGKTPRRGCILYGSGEAF